MTVANTKTPSTIVVLAKTTLEEARRALFGSLLRPRPDGHPAASAREERIGSREQSPRR